MGGLVSVVTAVHAPSVPYLAEAWGSLAGQDLPDGWAWEWLVQEDGACGAGEVLPADEARIRLATSRPAGVAVARTMALARAEGSLVRVLDADDLLTPGALARDIAALGGRRDLGWATSAALDLAADGSTHPPAFPDPPGGPIKGAELLESFRESGYRLPVHPATLCIRRRLAVALGGWTALPAGEDTGLLMAAAAVDDGYFTAEPGLLYRRHAAQVSADARADEAEWRARMGFVDARAEALAALLAQGGPAPTPAAGGTGERPRDVEKSEDTYQWLDRHGTVHVAEIVAERIRDAQVWVYTTNADGERTLIARVTDDGRFLRRAGASNDFGLETTAAWNDLIEVCRSAHTAYNHD